MGTRKLPGGVTYDQTLSANRFGTANVVTHYSPDLTQGMGVRDYTWQGSLAAQHELFVKLLAVRVREPRLVTANVVGG